MSGRRHLMNKATAAIKGPFFYFKSASWTFHGHFFYLPRHRICMCEKLLPVKQQQQHSAHFTKKDISSHLLVTDFCFKKVFKMPQSRKKLLCNIKAAFSTFKNRICPNRRALGWPYVTWQVSIKEEGVYDCLIKRRWIEFSLLDHILLQIQDDLFFRYCSHIISTVRVY